MRLGHRRKPSPKGEDAYIAWLQVDRDWSRREALAYAKGGDSALARERGRIAHERRRVTLDDHIRDAEARLRDPVPSVTGISRLFVLCENPRCRLPKNHSGPHDFPRAYLISGNDVEWSDPP